jgi:hypothetical protein
MVLRTTSDRAPFLGSCHCLFLLLDWFRRNFASSALCRLRNGAVRSKSAKKKAHSMGVLSALRARQRGRLVKRTRREGTTAVT